MTRSGLILDERYRLDKRIAAGGVGQVWQATDLLLERAVAVKVLRPEYADHPETLERFRKEARHAGALSHPHVAQVYDYGSAGPDWPPYLVLEFVGGPSLADILAIDPVDPAIALDVIAQAADGLSAAHRVGLVHRDVKPGNILIGPEGQVKVTDFGIAHAAGQEPVTGPNLVMGTTQYMAPERIAGGQGTPASDLYALGIVLHECLTGVPPYEGAPADVMAAHLYQPLPPLRGVPAEVQDLVNRLTAKDPADRISDARELAATAAELRDAITSGRLGAAPRASVLSGAGAAAGPARLTAVAAEPDRGGAGPGPGNGAGTLAGSGFGADSDEWNVPPRMSLPFSPADLAAGGRPPGRRRRRAGALAVITAVLAGAILVTLLVAGALRSSPEGSPSPASTAPTGAAGAAATRGAVKAAKTAPGTVGTAAPSPGATTAQSARATKKASPTASASPSTSASGSASASASASASGSVSASPSPTSSASSASSPSGTPAPTPTPTSSASPTTPPSPSPSADPTTPVACVLGICL